MKCVLLVSTYNRQFYLQPLLETFVATCNTEYNWEVVINDDGSTDTTLDYLKSLKLPYPLHVLHSDRKGISWATNQLFEKAKQIGFNTGFKVDDDIYFLQKGWDDLYIDCIAETDYQHLGYHHEGWHVGKHYYEKGEHLHKNRLVSYSNAIFSQGNFYTVTPKILEIVGYFDYKIFGLFGMEHADYSIRCCRVGFNERDRFWIPLGCTDYIGQYYGEEYKGSLSKEEVDAERRKYGSRMSYLDQDDRIFIENNNH